MNKPMKSYFGLLLMTALLFSACAKVMHIAAEGSDSIRMNDRMDQMSVEPQVQSLIDPYKHQVDAEMNEVLAISTSPLVKEQPEGTMGNWVADATQNQAEIMLGHPVDFSICNYSGMRVNRVSEGEITRRYMYEIMPFDNFLVVMELDGPTTKRLFDHMAAEGGWPISASARYMIDGNAAQNITINGEALDQNRSYTVVLSDYIANGGSGCSFLQDVPHEALNIYYRDAMIEEAIRTATEGSKMDPKIEGRVKVLAHE